MPNEVHGSIFDAIATPSASQTKRDAILSAASIVFIQHGYEGASMDLVAQAAGAARRTLYNQFPAGKEELFRSVAERMWRAFPVMDIATDEEALADPEAGLRRIGYGIAGFWAPPLAIAFLRMVISERPRFPDLTRSFFEVGKTPAMSAVRNYIAELGRRGILKITNAELTSRQFLGLIDESVLWGRVMGDDKQLRQAEVKDIVEQGVDIFLGYYLVVKANASSETSRPVANKPKRAKRSSK
ncbi:TetR/AcrR family transcriptional regulator [Acidisoma cellulosilytica]|uniref:TetR/AcrR family transcriptional regulator n=1 Tax=Acidisoma cellulosilyticum TaxID=2802395 RepID=A0A964E6E3_9PROT|nr:TetR/AcrR family transcriptional regulator [Acidisoma cellulosilyticum]MCB8883635.1 TetR/AcrR family transcriptional regulator [Acidisoma cellulosilyticum]